MAGYRSFMSIAAIVVGMAVSNSVPAQTNEADRQLLNEILEATNSVSPGTAREAHGRCVELGKKVAARTDIDATLNFALMGEVESCISYAMNNGKFSDETGDECSHHYASTVHFANAIKSAQNKKGILPEQLLTFRDRIRRASEMGPTLGCKGDYQGLIKSLPAVDVLPPLQDVGVPDEQIMRHITGATNEIAATQSEAWIHTCKRFSAGVEQREELTIVERTYFAALIENCIATAMSRGNMSDETGDACVHHHLYASKLAETLLLDKATPFFNDDFRQFVSEELKVLKRQGPGMGCKQDYGALQEE